MLNSGLLCLNKYKNEKKGCLCTTDVFLYDSVASMHFDCPSDFAKKKKKNRTFHSILLLNITIFAVF